MYLLHNLSKFDAFLCHMPAIYYKRNCKTIASIYLVSFAVDECENVLHFAAEVVFCLNTMSELDNSKMCELASNLFDGVIVLY
uniref:Uncharacterized protein n=1 Tax=Glossina palpalis gambiensis TaxID=67801 RepID=A0A1B0BDH5_9MUSC